MAPLNRKVLVECVKVIEKSETGKSAMGDCGRTWCQRDAGNKETMCPYCDQFGFILLLK